MKGRQAPGFEVDVSAAYPGVVFVILFVVGDVFALGSSLLPHPQQAPLASSLFVSLAIFGWLLNKWKPAAGRWFAVLSLIGLIAFVDRYLAVPNAFVLLAIPACLSVPLLGLAAAAGVAAIETAVLFMLEVYSRVGSIGTPSAVWSLVVFWGVFGVTWMVYRSGYQLAHWAWGNAEYAHKMLAEARNQRAQLKQALKDVAQANRELALTNERLAAARRVAEEAQKTKAAFVANVSHEFRTPLNMIVGLTDFILGRPDAYGRDLPPALLEDMEIVRRNSEHLASMVNDVLDLSQIESNRMVLRKEWVHLGEVTERALAVVRPLLATKGLGMKLDLPADLPPAFCDRVRIRQVIVNLISNAARFTDKGGITVSAVVMDGQVILSVNDTGPGIPPEEAIRLFEPFQQATSTARKQGGSGLGLSISKRFVELHGGQMWLDSTVGVGSTFSFRLPLSPAPEPVARPERWIAQGWSWVERTERAALPILPARTRMIVCDAGGALHELLCRHTDQVEFVDTRNLGQAAHELERCPAGAVLLNVGSPADSQSATEQAAIQIRDTPIIGCSIPSQLERIEQAGAAGFLAKPVAPKRLGEALAEVGRPVRRVLVVDDDADTTDYFARVLRATGPGIEVSIASSGEEALQKSRTVHADLILLDLVLPDMEGWQVLRAIKEDESLRDTPVYIVSAQDPRDRPPLSRSLTVGMGEGLSLSDLLRCSRAMSALLLHPSAEPAPEPG